MTAPSIDTDLIAYNFNIETTDFIAQLRAQANPSLTGQSFMHELAREGDVLSAEVMLDKGATFDAPDEQGRRPLHEAAAKGHADMIGLLLAHGALLDAPIHPFGWTALYLAVQHGRLDAARLLLARGANAAVEDRLSGQGLLHVAARNGDTAMAGVLIAAGADIFREDSRGLTPRDHAARAGYRELERTLLKVMTHHALYCG